MKKENQMLLLLKKQKYQNQDKTIQKGKSLQLLSLVSMTIFQTYIISPGDLL